MSYELKRELATARAQTDGLFGLIAPETLYERPVAERHRLIFYRGHFEAFDWNVLARQGLGEPGFEPALDRLFERGIDPEPGQAPADQPSDWPSIGQVERYVLATREWIDANIDRIDPMLVHMVIEHRQMHAETFAYLLHQLPLEEKDGAGHPEAECLRKPAPGNPMVEIAAGTVTLGASGEEFGWDNERDAHEVPVAAYRVSKFKISNGEYLEFVKQGGPVPHFWRQVGGEWFYQGMFSQVPLPLSWPAWTTWNQASAYARWRGAELPTEAQFQLAAAMSAAMSAPDAERDNFDYRRWDPVPVDHGNEGVAGPAQMVGNGWEWTRDIFAPYEGFRPHPFYPLYSADFFDAAHYVMKGGSPRTAGKLTRASFRNWFRPDYPYMYAGFRIVGK